MEHLCLILNLRPDASQCSNEAVMFGSLLPHYHFFSTVDFVKIAGLEFFPRIELDFF
jgi:hypothetical protein